MQTHNQRRGWRRLMFVHTVLFTMLFTYVVYFNAFAPPWQRGEGITLALLWLPLFVAHVALHMLYEGTVGSVERERQAYREGYSDGAANALPRERLARLSDDGELLEADEPKRKRSQ